MNKEEVKLSSFDNWLADEKVNIEKLKLQYPQYKDNYDKNLESKLIRRTEMHTKLPFVVCVEGFDPALSYAHRWCWQQFGPYEGKCTDYQVEYPACPLVLATEYDRKYKYKDKCGNMIEDSEKEYKDPGEHYHQGDWSGMFIDKTGYDYFVVEYCFKTEEMKQKFLEACPSFDCGEKYRE